MRYYHGSPSEFDDGFELTGPGTRAQPGNWGTPEAREAAKRDGIYDEMRVYVFASDVMNPTDLVVGPPTPPPIGTSMKYNLAALWSEMWPETHGSRAPAHRRSSCAVFTGRGQILASSFSEPPRAGRSKSDFQWSCWTSRHSCSNSPRRPVSHS